MKRICFLSLYLLLTSTTSSYTTSSYVADNVERNIVRKYQKDVLNNARYNNYKDSRRKMIQREIDNLRIEISYYNNRIYNLNNDLTTCKEKRTQLDGQLAELMCLDDLGDPSAKSRISKLKGAISLNEKNIVSLESERSSCALKKSDLETRLFYKQQELNNL